MVLKRYMVRLRKALWRIPQRIDFRQEAGNLMVYNKEKAQSYWKKHKQN